MRNYNSKLKILRKGHSQFIYRSYSYKISGGNLKISFFFEIPPDIKFKPQIIVKNISRTLLVRTRSVLDNLVFHIGLMEMISYWKATCSPEIIIEAGFLNKEQIKWWHNLIIKGMGQFFYENKIDWQEPRFLKITSSQRSDLCKSVNVTRSVLDSLKDRYMVPFAGGRDSIVTLEGLRAQKKEIILFTVNTAPKIQKTVKISGIKKQIIVKRKIDKKLLELNKKGYLNGHTPFTGLLSFLSVLCAVLFEYKNIAFSSEKSANEGNLKYLGRIINHQWAKSSEFEKMFQYYSKKYLAVNINYFSYLRNYGDLKISEIFINYPQYLPVFSSCNAGFRIVNNPPASSIKSAPQQTRRWCGNCPKCLFVYLSLYPYLDKKKMLQIFGRDLFENKKLAPVMKALLGEGASKPLECVGAYKESKKAFRLSFEKAQKEGKIPHLLKIARP